MKNLLSNNWQAKLVCLLIAVCIWAFLRNQVDPTFFDRLFTGTLTPGR
jgi:YbbR domain-containing protein